MRSIVLKYGLLGGAIIVVLMMIHIPLEERLIKMNIGEVVGYATMVIALSMVFVGVKKYRDQQRDKAITFLRAFTVGILITLITSMMYTCGWLVISSIFFPDFTEKYTAIATEKIQKKDIPQAEKDKKIKEVRDMMQMLKNPVLNFLVVTSEILFPGIIITLLTAALLQRKPNPPVLQPS